MISSTWPAAPLLVKQNNLRFQGQQYDEETGLHYNRHRYYDPSQGRYLSLDPIGLAGGVNLVGYVGGNPVSISDPKGLMGSRGNSNQGTTSIYVQGGVGAQVMLGVVGGSVSESFAISTGWQACRIETYCGRIGLGLYVGVGFNLGAGMVSGNTSGLGGLSVGGGADIGAGPSAGVAASVGLPGPSSVGATKGIAGPGVGADIGVDICYSVTHCLDEPKKEPNVCNK